MSKKTALVLAAFVAMAIPSAAFGQIGIAARIGTLGAGGEVAIGLGKHLQVRGGLGILGLEREGTLNDKTYSVTFPDQIWNVGVDLFPSSGGFHVGAGILNRPRFDFAGSYTGSAAIGNKTYNGNITITGNMANESDTGPYGLIGFGRTSKSGFGISFDIGAAALKDGQVEITDWTCQSGTTNCKSTISQADIDAEEQKIEDDFGTFFKIHPILSLSVHIGLGGK
ncbi:MAG TPA: hypothetical protein VM100_12145 [Longimicrobiales bacterium]|nr:hypothetical protein [Longimicrobiales bacterium]